MQLKSQWGEMHLAETNVSMREWTESQTSKAKDLFMGANPVSESHVKILNAFKCIKKYQKKKNLEKHPESTDPCH